MIPLRLLPLTVILVRPAAGTDRYGNITLDYGDAASRAPMRVWIEQISAREPASDGRDPQVGGWLMVTNHTDLQARDRIEHGGRVFEIDGPPAPVHTPAGAHHVEARLMTVDG